MYSRSPLIVALLSLAAAGLWPNAAQAESAGSGETLRYSVNWPSGLSLGEASMSKKVAENGRVESEFQIDAGIPGFRVMDHFTSLATETLCSIEFEKRIEHGTRKGEERSTFDRDSNRVKRQTVKGGSSELDTGTCARDALAYLLFVRRELAAGRIPPEQTVWFGAPYQVRLQYRTTETLIVGEEPIETDGLNVVLKGKASEHTFQLNFARDAARTLVRVKVPFSMGLFSMDLVR
jgi:hypothetical protein